MGAMPLKGGGELGGFPFSLKFFWGVVRDESVDGGLDLALHDHRKLVVGEADAVVGEAVLREGVGADLLAAVAGADLLLAALGLELVDALGFYLVEACA